MDRVFKFAIIISSVFIWGCESFFSEVPIKKLPAQEPKLVVTGYISPQDTIVKVFVGLTNPFYTGESSKIYDYFVNGSDTTYIGVSGVVRDAEVSITSQGRKVNLENSFYNDTYTFIPGTETLEIIPGQTYKIEVKYKGKMAFAECTVPKNTIEFSKVSIDTVRQMYGNFIQYAIKSKVEWRPNPDIDSYFYVRGFVESEVLYVSENNYNGPIVEKRLSKEQFDFPDGSFAKSNKGDVLLQRDGGSIKYYSVSVSVIQNISRTYYPRQINVKKMMFELLNLDENISKFYNSFNSAYGGENPFVEAPNTFTNINGGLGCFGAYNTSRKFIKEFSFPDK